MSALITLLIWLLILALVVWVIVIVIDMLPLPAQPKLIAKIVVGLIALLVLLSRLVPLVDARL